MLGALCRVCGVLGRLAPVHRCARLVCCGVCAVYWATLLLFAGVFAGCVVLCVRCPGPLSSCSPVCTPGVLCCVCGVLGHMAPVHRCARPMCCVACVVSWATWFRFTSAHARCAVLCVRCPGPVSSCSPVCTLGVLCCVCSVLGHLAPVHRCARSVFCVACAVCWATWLLFTGAHLQCVVLCVRCPVPLGSCSLVCMHGVPCCACGVLGHLAPLHRCACSLCCVVGAVYWATWLLLIGVHALCVVLLVRCSGPLGSCSPVRTLDVLSAVCVVPWATRLLFTDVFAGCAVLRVWCPGPLGCFSPVCLPGVLCCMCGVLGLLVPVYRSACLVCCVACAVSSASWLLFTGVHAPCVVLLVRCPRPLGSCSPICTFDVFSAVCAVSWATQLLFTDVFVLCCVCGALGLLAAFHRCVCPVCCVACVVSWDSWFLFSGVYAWCVVLCVRCPGPLGSCSPGCTLGVLCCVCCVLGHLARVHCCTRSVCCVVCPVSWALWLLFINAKARCAVWCVRCPGPLGSCLPMCMFGVVRCVRCPGPLRCCSPVCMLGGLCCVCGVLGHLAPVHRWACSMPCAVCAVFWATRLLSTGVHAWRGVCAVSLDTWLLFTGMHAQCVVLGVWCTCPLGSLFPGCARGVLCVRCPRLRGACSPACTCSVLRARGRLCRVYGVGVGVGCLCVGGVVLLLFGCFAACMIPSPLHFSPRARVGPVFLPILGSCVPLVAAMTSSPADGLDALMMYAVFFCLRETLGIFMAPKTRCLVAMHSCLTSLTCVCVRVFVFGNAQE